MIRDSGMSFCARQHVRNIDGDASWIRLDPLPGIIRHSHLQCCEQNWISRCKRVASSSSGKQTFYWAILLDPLCLQISEGHILHCRTYQDVCNCFKGTHRQRVRQYGILVRHIYDPIQGIPFCTHAPPFGHFHLQNTGNMRSSPPIRACRFTSYPLSMRTRAHTHAP